MAITRLYMANVYDTNQNNGIAANSLNLDGKTTFVKRNASGFIDIATGPTDRIVGVNLTNKVFSSTNQTADLKRVDFYSSKERRYVVDISGGTVTVADEGKVFSLLSDGVVDGASKVVPTAAGTTAAAQINGQLELVKYISATSGVFRIFNK